MGQSTWHDQAVGVSRHARVSYVRNDIPDYLATQNGDFREDNISKQKLLKELNTMCWDWSQQAKSADNDTNEEGFQTNKFGTQAINDVEPLESSWPVESPGVN